MSSAQHTPGRRYFFRAVKPVSEKDVISKPIMSSQSAPQLRNSRIVAKEESSEISRNRCIERQVSEYLAELGKVWYSLYERGLPMSATDKYNAVLEHYSTSPEYWKKYTEKIPYNADICLCSRQTAVIRAVIDTRSSLVFVLCSRCYFNVYPQEEKEREDGNVCNYCCKKKISPSSSNKFCRDCWDEGERIPSEEYYNMVRTTRKKIYQEEIVSNRTCVTCNQLIYPPQASWKKNCDLCFNKQRMMIYGSKKINRSVGW